uniref:CSON011390 protein n=1 Tax=Culicoides sonorensis TaxID=179676 RepID=A0A336M3D8_CULSO
MDNAFKDYCNNNHFGDVYTQIGSANLPPVFTQDMNNLALSESTAVDTIVYTLEGYDPEGEDVTFGLIGSDNFDVNPKTGEVKIVKALDRETQDTLSFLVSIKDRVNKLADSENDNLVTVPISVIVLDENDNPPEFQNVPYEADVPEDTEVGTTIFDKILIRDKDTVGENLDIVCTPHEQNPDACFKFSVKILESNQDKLSAAVVLDDKLDYNERMIYQILLTATDGLFNATTSLEIHIKDVQNQPPVFQGSLTAVISEDSPIGTLVLTVVAKDNDKGNPRKIVYDLVRNPMDYFLLDSKSGELRTAKPLDKESLPDETGLIKLSVRAREVVDGVPLNDPLTSAVTQLSITIRDVNDSPPTFNQREYFVSLSENTPPGTPLPIEMSVHDPDVGNNAVFALRLDDVSEVFDVEPKLVVGSSQVSIRVANGTLDYENPNQRKFIVLVIAEETLTSPKLSSTATLTVQITDSNDNRPKFEHESYTASVSETAHAGQLVTTITAKDMDSGHFGEAGIRYELSGSGSHLFNTDPITGAITVARCPSDSDEDDKKRRKRDTINLFDLFADDETSEEEKKENHVTPAEVYEIKSQSSSTLPDTYHTYHTVTHLEANTMIVNKEEVSEPILSSTKVYTVGSSSTEATTEKMHPDKSQNEVVENTNKNNNNGPGTSSCLDYETQPVYFLSYKATDDDGKGQSSVVSLKIQLIDSNDTPPICESPLYRASIDEGATKFEPELFIKARDADVMSEISYRIIGDETVTKHFEIDKRTGQLSISKNSVIDVNHIHAENIFFGVEASDGLHSVLCNVNITIRDVNNHAPQFTRTEYMVTIEENLPIGTIVEEVNATDLDTGINAEIRYRIQQGNFDDFTIDNQSGIVTISRKLDFDRRNTYQIEIVASDSGTPSLSGTATLVVNIMNSYDKAPYFTPATQRAEISEDAEIGTLVHALMAFNPNNETSEALDYLATEPITAVDKDGKELNNSEEFKDLFRVDNTGKVYVNKPLKRDTFAVIRITVVVRNKTAPTIPEGKGLLIITIIDVNEFPPVFASPWTPETPKYHFQVVEEQPIDTILTTLQASDLDSTIAEYKLNENDYFLINNMTGLITSKKRIDYEKVKTIQLIAIVTDTGIPQLSSTATINIDVININDNDPIFDMDIYNFTVIENSPRGTIVGQIRATDNDDGQFGNIEYSLVGDYASFFEIESKTGEITVRNNSALDREVDEEMTITGVATDLAPLTVRSSTTVPINIRILDDNDNPPVFSQRIYYANVAENAAFNPPAAILQVSASDRDEGAAKIVKYFIKSGNRDNTFILDPDSGILYPRKGLAGQKGQFTIEIEARDGVGQGPHTDNAEIIIEVHSINQHRPKFIMPALANATIEIPENSATADYLMMTVKAEDPDEGDNGKLAYHLQVKNENVQETEEFTIDEMSGELRVKKNLDRKTRARYDLVLVAQAAFYVDKTSGDVFTNKSLDRETSDTYRLYILASKKPDLHISETERLMYSESIEQLERDSTVAKVQIHVLDLNDNPPVFDTDTYYAGISAKASINELVTVVNATDKDFGVNSTIEMIISASYLYKFGATKTTGSIVPSPFSISKDGRITTASYMAEYNQDRFILEIIAKEVEMPERFAKANVHVWIFDPEQLIRVILSRPPSEVHQEREEIISELSNATQKRIIVDEIRYHVDNMGRIRMDWCDLYFHAIDTETESIVPVIDILTVIDSQYDFLKDYYAGFAIENVVPAFATNVTEEFDIALAAIIALLIVLFVGTVSFIVLCCCLKHWVITIPNETRRKDALIKKQIIEDLNTTENPLWIEQKLKLYEEQELTMQVFSEPEASPGTPQTNHESNRALERRDSYETANTYATIQPRNISQMVEIDDYASLRNTRPPSLYEFRGSTFQVQQRDPSDYLNNYSNDNKKNYINKMYEQAFSSKYDENKCKLCINYCINGLKLRK